MRSGCWVSTMARSCAKTLSCRPEDIVLRQFGAEVNRDAEPDDAIDFVHWLRGQESTEMVVVRAAMC